MCIVGSRFNVQHGQLTQVLVYAEDVNILVGSMLTIRKNTKALVIGSKETRLEVNS